MQSTKEFNHLQVCSFELCTAQSYLASVKSKMTIDNYGPLNKGYVWTFEKQLRKLAHLWVTTHIAWDSFPKTAVSEDNIFLAWHLSHDLDQFQAGAVGYSCEIFGVYIHTKCTDETFSVQQCHQNPNHGCQKGPLHHRWQQKSVRKMFQHVYIINMNIIKMHDIGNIA